MTLPPTEAEWRVAEAARRKIMEDYVSANPETSHQYAGMSLLDIAWQELDDVMDLLMEQGAPDKRSMVEEFVRKNTLQESRQYGDEWYTTLKEWGELRGQAQGLAFAIAVMTNPYAADVPAVKKEAIARWESRG